MTVLLILLYIALIITACYVGRSLSLVRYLVLVALLTLATNVLNNIHLFG